MTRASAVHCAGTKQRGTYQPYSTPAYTIEHYRTLADLREAVKNAKGPTCFVPPSSFEALDAAISPNIVVQVHVNEDHKPLSGGKIRDVLQVR